MPSIENMIAWMQARKGRVTYSMTSRMGPNSYDCSSSVFFAMIAGGFLSAGSMGNTETLFGMSGTKLKEISRGEVQRGDIFIRYSRRVVWFRRTHWYFLKQWFIHSLLLYSQWNCG